jgi:biotin carboxylase
VAKQYLLVVNHVVANIVSAVDELRHRPELAGLELLAITDKPDFNQRYAKYIPPERVISVNFDDANDIQAKLAPYAAEIAGVICRGDRHIQYLRRIRPFLPSNIRVASAKALENSTNKRLMRQCFRKYPEITPDFVQADDSSAATLEHIETELGFPVIIKPANLFSSLLIQVCQNRQQLERGLKRTFGSIRGIYSQRDIREKPQVIVEEYLEGDFFSIDAYVMKAGDIGFCPPVEYIPAKKIGIDDFFLYKRFIPTNLSDSQISAANETLRKALDSVGLTYSSVHAELVLTAKGWKMIEIGPRLGRFRHMMYQLSYGIDHSLNDVRIHLGLQPEIPTRLLQGCAAYSIYPGQEGRITRVHGLELLDSLPEVKYLKIHKKTGDAAVYAKHGGTAILEFVIASADPERMREVTTEIEVEVYADID